MHKNSHSASGKQKSNVVSSDWLRGIFGNTQRKTDESEEKRERIWVKTVKVFNLTSY